MNAIVNPVRFSTGRSTRRVVAAFLTTAAAVLVLGAVSPSSDSGLLAQLSPQPAEAYQGGWDRDHWWIKVTRGEVASGAVSAVCWYFVRIPARSYICTPLSVTAKRIIGGASGFWAEIYPPKGWRPAYVRVGTW